MGLVLFLALLFASQAPAESALERAQILHANGQAGEALALYAEHLAAKPNDARAEFLFARAANTQGQPAATRAALKRARVLDPKNADLYAWELLWRADQGDVLDKEMFAGLVELKPSDLTTISVFSRLQVSFKFGDPAMQPMSRVVSQFRGFDAVRGIYRNLLPHVTDVSLDLEALDLDAGDEPMNWDAWSLDLHGKATTAAGSERWARGQLALREYANVIAKLMPLHDLVAESGELTRMLMQAHGNLKGYTDALGVAERRMARAEGDISLKVDAATLLARQQQLEAAAAMVERASELDPSHPRVLIYRAQVANHEQRVGDARALLSRVLKAQPDNVIALDELSKLEAREGANVRAAELLERALRRQPWRTRSWLRCAQEFARGGRIEKAREVLKLGLSLGADPGMAEQFAQSINREAAKQNGTQQQ